MSPTARTTLIPGPDLPASEQVRRWVESPVDFWEECQTRFGSVVALELGSLGSVVLLSDPADVKALFQLPAERFECRQYNEHYRYLMGDRSLLLQDGATHKRQRRLLGPALRHERFLPDPVRIRDIVGAALDGWRPGSPFNPRPDLHDVTFQIIVDTLFGDRDSPASSALVSGYRRVVLPQRGAWGPWRSFTRLQPRIRELIEGEIRARRGTPERAGVLTELALARDAEGLPLSQEECVDHVFSLMIAGVDTTAVSLTWALYWLCREPEIHAAIVDELSSSTGAATAPDLLSLPYLDAVFRETLRMYPVVPTPSGRRLTSSIRLREQVIPAGTTLVPCTYLVHRREDLYPESARFVPLRFMERRFAAHEYFPFGGGVRRCVGEALAHLEFKIALATILERWKLCPVSRDHPRVIRHGTLLAPADEFRMRVEARDSTRRGES